MVAKLHSNTAMVPDQRQEAGLVTITGVSDSSLGPFLTDVAQAVRYEQAARALDTAPPLGEFRIVAEGPPPLLPINRSIADSPDAKAFRDAAKAHQACVEQAFQSVIYTSLLQMELDPINKALNQKPQPRKD